MYVTNEFDTYFKTISVQVFSINTSHNSRRVIQSQIIMQTILMQHIGEFIMTSNLDLCGNFYEVFWAYFFYWISIEVQIN